MKQLATHRILIVDDNPAIHHDFQKILCAKHAPSELEELEAQVFGEDVKQRKDASFQLESAFQGEEGFGLVEKAMRDNNPYSVAFVDVRMPPGWDGVETIKRIWGVDPNLQVVLCTAYSDYSWREIIEKLERRDQLIILKKPFDIIEVQQLVHSLTEKWTLGKRLAEQLQTLDELVQTRTAALENTATTLRATLEATGDGIVVLDNEGTIQTYNGKFLELWKVPEVLAATKDRGGILAHFRKQIENQEIHRKFLKTDDSLCSESDLLYLTDKRIFEYSCHPQMRSGQLAGRVWSFRDVTQRMALEQEARQAQKMDCVGHLAGGIAHDFNNILTIIQGHAALLLDVVEPTGLESVEQIAHASERAASLTRQLLAFSRRNVLSVRDVDLFQVTSAFSRMLSRLIGEHISLRIINESKCALIRGDVGMLEQILMNLAVNSKDAMPSGGSLTIRLRNVSVQPKTANGETSVTPQDYVCLEVIDTGTGIAPEITDRIFEPFFTTKDVGKGTGLGLPTVYGIMQQHKGWIEVESKLSHGSTFQLFFPLKTQQRPVATPAAMVPSKPRGGDEWILLVEDEAHLRRLVADLLKKQGYNVLEAESGKSALEILKAPENRVDVVLTDIVMPEGVSGIELADRLQSIRPSAKVILSSGYSSDLFEKQGSSITRFKYLQKPYSPDVLSQVIRETLDSAREPSNVRAQTRQELGLG